MNKGKRKGGAEKERDRKKRRLMEESSKCQNLDSFLKPVNSTEHETETNTTKCVESTSTRIESASRNDGTDNLNLNDELVVLEENNFFNRPANYELIHFFEYHPQRPKSQKNLPFNIQKVFDRDNDTQRQWLTYSTEKSALFCSICLAFCGTNESNSFIEGMRDWKHVYQRLNEHESSNMHTRNIEAYIRFSANKTIDKYVFRPEVIEKKQSEISQNRQILHRVVDIIKLIGKRGLSFR